MMVIGQIADMFRFAEILALKKSEIVYLRRHFIPHKRPSSRFDQKYSPEI